MNPDEERLIALATSGLSGNAELRLAAEEELRGAVADQSPASLKEAVDSFERADRHPQRGRRWKLALLAVMAVVSVPLLVQTALEYRQLSMMSSLITFSGPPLDSKMDFPDLTPPERLLLFGDTEAADESGKWKALWDSEPGNPSYLAVYASGYFSDHKSLSPEILGAAERIDPDNGWFPALAAAGIANGAVKKESTPYATKKGPRKAPIWKINDNKRFQEALEGIHRLVEKSKFPGYQKELFRQRVPLVPARTDLGSQILQIAYLADQRTSVIAFRQLADVLAAGAQQCAANGDVEGFQQITGDWQALTSKLIRNGEGMIDLLIARVFFTCASNFRDAARELDLKEDEMHFSNVIDRWQAEKDARDAGASRSEQDTMISQRASVIANLTLSMLSRQVMNPPVLTEAELRPERYAEHALIGRAGAWATWVLLGVCAGFAALARFRSSRLARGLSVRMVALLRPSDWIWLLAGGIVFPLFWYFLVTRMTPLSAREWSAQATGFIQAAGQIGSLAMAMIILPGTIASWRLAKRGAALGLEKPRAWFGCASSFLALVAIPLFGAAMLWKPFGGILQIVGTSVAFTAMTWLVAGFAMNVFGGSSQALRRATLARIVWPVWLFGMLAMVAFVPFYRAEERYWVLRDPIFKISPERPAMSGYEYDVTQVLRGELWDELQQN